MSEFETRVPRDPAQLASLRHMLSHWLERVGIADPPRADVVLATHEAAANAIEHSGASEPVVIRGQISDGAIAIQVSDRGGW